MEGTPTPRSSPGVSRYLSLGILLAIIALMGLLFYRVMAIFLLPLFLAALLAVLFQPLHQWFVPRLKRFRSLPALATTGVIVLLILLPLAWIFTLAVQEGLDLMHRDWSFLRGRLAGFRQTFGLVMPYSKAVERLTAHVQQLGVDAASNGEVPILDQLLDRLDALTVQIKRDLAEDVRGEAPLRPLSPVRAVRAHARLELMQAAVGELRGWQDSVKARQGLPESERQRYREIAGRVDSQFRLFRQELLGGPLRSWAIEMANPSPQVLRGWQQQLSNYLRSYLVTFTGQTTAFLGRFLFGTAIMVIAVFYFLLDGPGMLRALMRLSPLDNRHEEKLLSEFSQVSRAVVLATLLSAVAQGILAGLGYYFAGAQPLVFLTILTAILALVPFVGAAAVWVPAALWLAFIENRMGAAIGLSIYGLCIISMADNLIKPWVLHGQSNIHPLVGLLSVLGGVQALGPIGILVGPMLVAFLHALLNILHQELTQIDSPA